MDGSFYNTIYDYEILAGDEERRFRIVQPCTLYPDELDT
jgi:hypothetical protein